MRAINENIKKYLKSKSEEEIDKDLDKIQNPSIKLRQAAKTGLRKYVDKTLESGASNIDEALIEAIKRNHTSLSKYLFNKLLSHDESTILKIIHNSMGNKNLELFEYFVKNIHPSILEYEYILEDALLSENYDIAKFLIDNVASRSDYIYDLSYIDVFNLIINNNSRKTLEYFLKNYSEEIPIKNIMKAKEKAQYWGRKQIIHLLNKYFSYV